MRFKLFSRGVVIIWVCVALLGLTACAKKSLDQGPTIQSIALLSTDQLVQEADKAFAAKDYTRSELYYSRLQQRPGITEDVRKLSLERVAVSAMHTGHFYQARMSLVALAELDPQVLDSWGWHDNYVRALISIGQPQRACTHLEQLAADSGKNWELRQRAGEFLGNYLWKAGDYAKSMSAWARIYSMAPDATVKARLENDFSTALSEASEDELPRIYAAVTPENGLDFPYVLASYLRAKNLAVRSADDWPGAWRIMRRIVSESALVDKVEMKNILAELEQELGIPKQGIALALPLSGRYGGIGFKVLRGMNAAQFMQAKDGQEIEVSVVNTESPDWIEKLRELPSYYVVVGGPLRVSAFKQAVQAGVLEDKIFFTFLPSLGDTEEGTQAWRFFTSRQDQVRTLAKFAKNRLGIENMAVLYPKERYGRKMASIFGEELDKLGGNLTGIQDYTPKSPSTWGKSVASLLHEPEKAAKGEEQETRPDPDFGAVFIPDGWNQARFLAPQFYFFEEDRLLLMGPELWSQALNSRPEVEARYFQLAVCPGAWSGHTPGARELAQTLAGEGLPGPDFWTALGYDFLRFAAGLGNFSADWTPGLVNQRIQMAQYIRFSLAPMSWDTGGVGRQDLFLFRPVRSGKVLVDDERFLERYKTVVQRRQAIIEARRLEAQGLDATNSTMDKPAGDNAAPENSQPMHPDREPGTDAVPAAPWESQ